MSNLAVEQEPRLLEKEHLIRRYPIGAEPIPGGGFHFRVWAPKCLQMIVRIFSGQRLVDTVHLDPEAGGYFNGESAAATAGMDYQFEIEGRLYPDPASRFQPSGPHGPSRLIHPDAFPWTDQQWKGVSREGQILYEMHIGTFTPEGTWTAAMEQLPELASLGITVVELMPVSEFPGRFGWGYDGVDLFAPTRLYGNPEEMKAFVNRAHELGLGVILDVVYNHLGPDGNYLKTFSDHYFSKKYRNEWGEALNFDGENSGPSREFFITNAHYWIAEYHLDGLRLDATQQIFDESPTHIIKEIARTVRSAGKGRGTYLVAENEKQVSALVRGEEENGFGLDGLWNDDFHHSARVALTGKSEAYYCNHKGAPQEFISAMKYGYLYQGQYYPWQKQNRGQPAFGLHPTQFINYIQNHDQVANSLHGARLDRLTSPGRLRAITVLLLLAPGTPMLFQGQEFGASAPFTYFADHNPELCKLVWKGRREFLEQFPSIAPDPVRELVQNPRAEEPFLKCKLDFSEREKHAVLYRLHRDLIAIRKKDPVFSKPATGGVDGAVLGPECFLLRYFGTDAEDRLMIVNLGPDLTLSPAPEPLLAPPEERRWEMILSSEDPCYGGSGTPEITASDIWTIPAHSTVVFAPGPLRKNKWKL